MIGTIFLAAFIIMAILGLFMALAWGLTALHFVIYDNSHTDWPVRFYWVGVTFIGCLIISTIAYFTL